MEMLDELTLKYFEEKFKNITDKMDDIVSTMNRDIERHRDDLDTLFNRSGDNKQRIEVMKDKLDSHLESHKETKGDRQFTIGQIIVVIVLILTVLSDKFL